MSFIVVYVGIRIGNSTRRNDIAYLLHAERYGQYFFEPQEPGEGPAEEGTVEGEYREV